MTAATIACEGCREEAAQGREMLCDGSGVIAVTDWPASHAHLCPRWGCDEAEPDAYYEALAWAHPLPPEVAARLEQTIKAEVVQQQQDRAQVTPAQIIAEADRLRRTVASCLILIGTVVISYLAFKAMTR